MTPALEGEETASLDATGNPRFRERSYPKKIKCRTGEMAAFPEDPSSVPRTHMEVHNQLYVTPVPHPLLVSKSMHVVHRHTCSQNTQTSKI